MDEKLAFRLFAGRDPEVRLRTSKDRTLRKGQLPGLNCNCRKTSDCLAKAIHRRNLLSFGERQRFPSFRTLA